MGRTVQFFYPLFLWSKFSGHSFENFLSNVTSDCSSESDKISTCSVCQCFNNILSDGGELNLRYWKKLGKTLTPSGDSLLIWWANFSNKDACSSFQGAGTFPPWFSMKWWRALIPRWICAGESSFPRSETKKSGDSNEASRDFFQDVKTVFRHTYEWVIFWDFFLDYSASAFIGREGCSVHINRESFRSYYFNFVDSGSVVSDAIQRSHALNFG